MAVLIVSGILAGLELFNTAIEKLSDVVSPGLHREIKKVKDLASAAVLVAVLTAAVVGAIVFLPKISAGLAH